jgi:hypothetical protein
MEISYKLFDMVMDELSICQPDANSKLKDCIVAQCDYCKMLDICKQLVKENLR